MTLSVDIRKRLGRFQLDVQFQTGLETMALLGASGSGKSVTLRCIAGIMTPDEGRIVLDGVTLFDSARKINLPTQQRQVGYLFQQYALFPHMTVRQNIACAVRDMRQRDPATTRKLRQFQLEDVADHRPSQLSGGQQQRTALARILAASPRAILLDEPFSALDSALKEQLEVPLRQTLDAFLGPVLWVSHDRGEVFRNCQHVCVLDQGRSQGTYTPRSLFQAPETEAAARLAGCGNLSPAVPSVGGILLTEWGLNLRCANTLPSDLRQAGIHARHLRPASEQEENAFPCTILQVIQDVFTTILLLRPDGAPPDSMPLRMELPRELWQTLPSSTRITVRVPPEEILLLR